MKNMQRTLLSLFLGALGGCGASSSQENPQSQGSSGTSADATAEDGRVTERRFVSLTADYRLPPVDLLIIRENTGAWNRQPFAGRWAAAVPILAARLQYAQLDLRVKIVEAGLPNWAAVPAPTPVDEVLAGDSPTFAADLAAAMQLRSSGDRQAPLTVIHSLVSGTSKDLIGVGTEGFLREGAKLAILMAGASDEVQEQLLPIDVAAALDTRMGRGRWIASALVPDKLGCVIDATTGQRTNLESYVRRNLQLRLQEMSQGMWSSICEDSYSLFFDALATEGTGTTHFDIRLPALPPGDEIVSDSVEVTAERGVVRNWRLHPDDMRLEVPTLVRPGMQLTIAFDVRTLHPTIVGPADNAPDETPDVVSREISPEEQEFVDEINPVLASSCGGCHGANSGRVFVVGNFANALANRGMILNRIERVAGDPLRMPTGGMNIPEPGRGVLVEWLSR